MRLYIVRHGDPDYEHNTITPRGHEEAAALAEWFDQIPLNEIYTSPLGRAIDTAEYTCKRQHLQVTVLPWTEESMDYMQRFTPEHPLSYRFSSELGAFDFVDYHPDRSERLTMLIKEADAFLAEQGYERQGAHYAIKKPNNKHVAVFCHGGFGVALTAHLLGLPPALGFSSMFMTTSSVTTFEFRDHFGNGFTRPRMIRFGETAHLQLKGTNSEG